ncbi:MAG: 16S rRNA (cytidine(1402)-2'-O)-methyltransferase [Thermoanaerobaculia bacterium]
MSGRLTVVATPIGNLGDLSERARAALEDADLVACEDTRRTGALLSHLGIRKKMVSLHDHNERQRLPALIAGLETGRSIALVSDAGTPLLSDPGFLLVRECAARGIHVEAVPGASAILAALITSGLPPYPFTFAGFAPPRAGKRRRFFERFAALDHTLVFFESPHRLLPSLEDALEVLGDRPVAVARELTKLHEEVLRGQLSKVLERLREQQPRGEYVLVIGSAPASADDA